MDGPILALWGSSMMALWLIQMVFWVGWSEATFIMCTLERWPLPSGLYLGGKGGIATEMKAIKGFASLSILSLFGAFSALYLTLWLIFLQLHSLDRREPGLNPGLWHSSHWQSNLLTTRLCPETHSTRQATQQAQLAGRWGQKGIEIVYGEENLFCTGPTRAAKAEQKSFLLARQAQQTRAPFICPV